MKIRLAIIDPQNSFCEIVPAEKRQLIHSGELFVPGSVQDVKNIANFIRATGHLLNGICVSGDRHRQRHCGHPIWWKFENGNHPEPFSRIILDEQNNLVNVALNQSGDWEPVGKVFTSQKQYDRVAQQYLEKLKQTGWWHTIWPYHCIEGTRGCNIVEEINTVLLNWEKEENNEVNYFWKGQNPFVEQYSIVKPVVELYSVYHELSYPRGTNWGFIDWIVEGDVIIWTGEALSHCLGYSMDDTFSICSEVAQKSILLSDAGSVISGFEENTKQKIEEWKNKGVKIMTTKECIELLGAK